MWPHDWTERAYRLVYAQVFGLCRDAERALDCTQHAFQQAARKCQERRDFFESERHFVNWLVRVAKNGAISEKRSAWRRRVAAVSDPGILAEPGDDADAVRACLAELPERDRRILEWSHFDRLTDKQVGRLLWPDDPAPDDALGLRAWRLRQKAEALLRKRLLDEGVAPDHWNPEC